MNELVYDLMRIGFSEKESIVYVALLGGGSMSAGKIIENTLLSRASVYRILENIGKKGLLQIAHTSGEKYYIAEPPERIQTLLQMQREEIDERKRRADILLLKLRALHQSNKSKPRVRYFESLAGLRIIQREYERYDDDILQIVGYDAFLALHDPKMTQEHRTELKISKRKVRSIVISSSQVEFRNLEYVEYIVLPPEVAPINGEIAVCGDRVVFFSYADGIAAVEITSKTIASTVRFTFELAWNEAKRISEIK